ncbi:MAG: GntR family transcriptional regulator [Myxococcota bacterium]|nr:GntR family transcriptional regulator [Myxococcota bacterium]MDW8361909.1 GntR family transcriptional regulator [Myxococcales bacterium]
MKKSVDRAADAIRAWILGGKYRPGDFLPGERELTGLLGVSRITVRGALARLRAEGLVRPEQGAGTRVLDFRESSGVDLLAVLAAQRMAGGPFPLDLLSDLLELRRLVAVELVGLVGERATTSDLSELRALVGQMRGVTGDPSAFMTADLRFARRLVRASRNLALELLANAIVRALEGQPGLHLAFGANAARTVIVYEHLLSLLERGRVEKARAMTRRLLERLDRSTLALVAALSGATPREPSIAGTPTAKEA